MNKLHDYATPRGWSWYVGLIRGYPGFTARAWKDLPQPIRLANGQMKWRDCISASGATADAAAQNCYDAVITREQRCPRH